MLGEVEARLSERGPEHSDRLLLSAHHLASSARDDQSAARAIVLAVTAAEIEIKTKLRDVASTDQVQLVDVLIDNPRDWSVSLHSLFKSVLPTLADIDDSVHKSLAKELPKTIWRRNQIVHRGATFDVQTARSDIALVRRIVESLRAI